MLLWIFGKKPYVSRHFASFFGCEGAPFVTGSVSRGAHADLPRRSDNYSASRWVRPDISPCGLDRIEGKVDVVAL